MAPIEAISGENIDQRPCSAGIAWWGMCVKMALENIEADTLRHYFLTSIFLAGSSAPATYRW